MARQTAFSSFDFSQVESLLVRPSAGSNPLAAVAWSEIQDFLSQADLTTALSSLFHDEVLTGGITEQRPGADTFLYFFTRFEVNLTTLSPGWVTRKFSDIDLVDQDGNSVPILYSFRITGEGTFTIEFQGSSNPVIPDGMYTLALQRRPQVLAAGNSILLANNATYNFPNGATIQIPDDGFSVLPFSAAGVAQEQQGILVPGSVKVNPSGFMAQVEDGQYLGVPDNSYIRYTLSADAIALPPVVVSQAEYSQF